MKNLTKILISILTGFILGYFAGVIGVGGGEFRLPVLIYILKLPIFTAITGNLLIGLLTVIATSVMRIKFGMVNNEVILIAIFMSITSVIGAYSGVIMTNKIKVKTLKIIISIFLIIAGIKFILNPLIKQNFVVYFLPNWQKILISLFIGYFVGIISGILGVAGGEYRIPLIIYLLGIDIKLAGTTSLFVSIPTQTCGFLKHYHLGHLEKKYLLIIILMGIFSFIGGYFGVYTAYFIQKETLELILGVILLFATVRMLSKP